MAHLGLFNCNWAAVGATAQAQEHHKGCHKPHNMRGVLGDIGKALACEGLVAGQAREEQNGASANKGRDVDPVHGLEPVHVLYPVAPALMAHGAQGIGTEGRGIHRVNPATSGA